MSNISEIPVEILNSQIENGEPSAQVLAVLSELETMLTKLISRQETNSIDIRSLPMMPGDYEQLKSILGKGEVEITVNTLGPSDIYETHVPGIWWISHKNAHDEVLTEFIEVTYYPEIIKVQDGDLNEAHNILQARVNSSDDNTD
jgi:hydrogenase-1 operon protein HyaF